MTRDEAEFAFIREWEDKLLAILFRSHFLPLSVETDAAAKFRQMKADNLNLRAMLKELFKATHKGMTDEQENDRKPAADPGGSSGVSGNGQSGKAAAPRPEPGASGVRQDR